MVGKRFPHANIDSKLIEVFLKLSMLKFARHWMIFKRLITCELNYVLGVFLARTPKIWPHAIFKYFTFCSILSTANYIWASLMQFWLGCCRSASMSFTKITFYLCRFSWFQHYKKARAMKTLVIYCEWIFVCFDFVPILLGIHVFRPFYGEQWHVFKSCLFSNKIHFALEKKRS